MKRQLSFFLMAITLYTSYNAPTLAGTSHQNSYPKKTCIEQAQHNSDGCSQKVTQKPTSIPKSPIIAKSTAVVVKFTDDIEFNSKSSHGYPAMLPLAFPISDQMGNVVFPAKTPVEVKLVNADNGLKIVGQSIMLPSGQKVSIEASSEVIPGVPTIITSRTEKASQLGPTLTRFGGAIGGLIGGGDLGGTLLGTLAGQAIAIVVGMNTPKTANIVRIPVNSLYHLHLKKAVEITPAIATPEQNNPDFSQGN